jgi:hypothetical protein
MNSTQIIISVNLDLPLFFRVAKLNGSILYVTKYNQIIDAQSFSNYFEGVIGVVRKSGRVSSTFVFYFIFTIHFLKSFEGVHEVPPPRPPSVCINESEDENFFRNIYLILPELQPQRAP